MVNRPSATFLTSSTPIRSFPVARPRLGATDAESGEGEILRCCWQIRV